MGNNSRRRGSSRRVTRTILVPVASGSSTSEIKFAARKKLTRTQLTEQTARNEERIQQIYYGKHSLSVNPSVLTSTGVDPEVVALIRERARGSQIVEDTMNDGHGGLPDWIDDIPVEDEFIQAMKDVQQLRYVPILIILITTTH